MYLWTGTVEDNDVAATGQDPRLPKKEGVAGRREIISQIAFFESEPSSSELWDALVDLFGKPRQQDRSLYGRVVAYLRTQHATPEEVRKRAVKIVELWGVGALTVTSLEKHWARWDGLVGQLSDADVDAFRREETARQRRALLGRVDWDERS